MKLERQKFEDGLYVNIFSSKEFMDQFKTPMTFRQPLNVLHASLTFCVTRVVFCCHALIDTRTDAIKNFAFLLSVFVLGYKFTDTIRAYGLPHTGHHTAKYLSDSPLTGRTRYIWQKHKRATNQHTPGRRVNVSFTV
jgi:hypothetical protein